MNKLCNDFKLFELTADNLKCLIFAQGLVSAEDAEVRRRVLTKLEIEQGWTLQKLAEDCQRVIKCDSKTIEESGVPQIRKIRGKSPAYSPQKDKRQISWMKFCPVKKKKYCKNCNFCDIFFYHNLTQCSYANITRKPKSKIRLAQSDDITNRNLRKYVTIDIFNSSIKFQLDSGSDISIINRRTWRKLNKPTLLKTEEIAKSVTGENINILSEVILTVTLNGFTKKLKAYVLKNSDNLFGRDWIEKFNLWDCPMSTLCRKIENTTSNSVNLKKGLKLAISPGFFLATLCTIFTIKSMCEMDIECS